MELFFIVFPFVYLNKSKNDTIFYNTISGDSLSFRNNPFMVKIVSRLQQQDYVCIVNEEEINLLNQLDFFKLLVEKNLGYYMNKADFPVSPLSTPCVDINETHFVSNFKNHEYIIENLREVTFYINSQTCKSLYSNHLTIRDAYKQFLFPTNNSKSNELPFSKIKKIIRDIETTNVNINILGGNIFKYSQFERLIEFLNKTMHNIFYFFHYTDLKTEVQKRYLSLINENETKTIFIDFPVMEIWLKKWEKIFEQENVQFEFIIESDSHISEAETIISTFDIQNYHFRPFYNGNNFQFFQENVFVSEDDILTVKESIFGLLTKKISNPAFFGKLTVDACGNIFTNTNLPSVGNIDDLELKQIIYEQITDDNSVWLKNKYGVEPCKNCIYNLLCPPISNYDYIFNQHDLCTVKYY